MDKIILGYNDVLLRDSDFALLFDGSWLNDNIISFVMESVNIKFDTFNNYKF